MTHEGRCTVFSAGLHPLGDHYGGLYRTPPLKNTILGRSRARSRRFSEKSAEPPPRRMVQRGGGDFHTFFSGALVHCPYCVAQGSACVGDDL